MSIHRWHPSSSPLNLNHLSPLVMAKVSKQFTLTIPTYQYISAIQRTPETHHRKPSCFQVEPNKKTFQNKNPIPTAEFPYMNELITSASAKSLQHHLIIDSPTQFVRKKTTNRHLLVFGWLYSSIMATCHWIPRGWPSYPSTSINFKSSGGGWKPAKKAFHFFPWLCTGQRQKLY